MAERPNGFTDNKEKVDLQTWMEEQSGAGAEIEKLKEAVANMWSTIYPVGSIYITVNNEDPSVTFGGTWIKWGGGRVPVGYMDSDPDFYPAEKIGGSKTHLLTNWELPSHNHSGVPGTTITTASYTGGTDNDLAIGKKGSTGYSGGNPQGTTIPFSILQPYIVCYMWKRTA